jgi:alpha-L-rhamnosidase
MAITRLTDLRCEYQTCPLGMDELRPRLSWRLEAGESDLGVRQSAYQVLVASSKELLVGGRGDLWDSGEVASSQSTQVEYAGKKLASRRACWWKVRAWDELGAASPWSEPACWEMGLLARADWKAKWIGGAVEGDPAKSLRCPQLRKGFALRGPVARARAYVSALGLYELWINGKRVGEDYFTPGWTDYNVRVQYQTYDVTDLVQAGGNAVGAVLGEGWYSGNMAFAGKRNLYGPFPRLLVQLVITYDDGRVETVATDGSWKSAQGPILESDLYNGETYDQRLELSGWSASGFDDSAWAPAKEVEPPKAKLVASASPRVRRINELAPLWVRQPSPGTFVFDLGQNMVGWVRLGIPAGAPAGTTITLRHAEVLNPDGTLYTANLRSAKCTDRLTLAGGAACTWEPHFTFHGFRFVEVSGLHVEPTLETVRGVVLHSDTPPAGTFECSSPMLTQLQKNITWGQKGNFLEAPTDCPQRDERLGWTGDAQVFVRTACYNMDVAGFFTKWLIDLEDEQSPKGAFPMVAPDVLAACKGDGGAAWADAGVICPWTIYLCYGDVRVLQRHYKAMQRYIEYQNHVDWSKRHCFGDWLNIEDPTPAELIGYAFWAYTTAIMIEVAGVLGHKADAAKYRAELKRLKGEFAQEFLTPRGRLASISQTGYLLALHFDLVPARLRPVVLERVVRLIHARKDHLSTGFVGTP